MYTNSIRLIKQRSVTLFTLLAISLFGFAQDDSLHTTNKKIAEDHCISSRGNGTFKVTLPQLEKVILGNFKQSNLIKILPQYACQYKLTFAGNTKTMAWDIPQYEFAYHYLNPMGMVVVITIEGNINNKIGLLKVNNIPGTVYDNLLATLPKSGYLFRESISNRADKHFYNKAKSLVVILHKNEYDRYYSVSIN